MTETRKIPVPPKRRLYPASLTFDPVTTTRWVGLPQAASVKYGKLLDGACSGDVWEYELPYDETAEAKQQEEDLRLLKEATENYDWSAFPEDEESESSSANNSAPKG